MKFSSFNSKNLSIRYSTINILFLILMLFLITISLTYSNMSLNGSEFVLNQNVLELETELKGDVDIKSNITEDLQEITINFNRDFLNNTIINLEIFTNSGIFVQREVFECLESCTYTFELEKIILEEYLFFFDITSENKTYELAQEVDLDFSFFHTLEYDFMFKDKYILQEDDFRDTFEIDFIINSSLHEEVTYYVDILNNNLEQIGSSQDFSCAGVCENILELKPPFILSTYYVRVYSRLGDSRYEFELIFEEEVLDEEIELEGGMRGEEEVRIDMVNESLEIPFGIINSQRRMQDFEVEINSINSNELSTFRNSDVENLLFQTPSKFREVADIKFKFNLGPVKNINVRNARFEEILIGYEEIPLSLARKYGFNVNNAFAIDPHFNDEVLEFEVTFVATANSVYKCVDYDFENQNCFGEFEFLMNTIPGEEYTIILNPEDPLFLQVENYVLSPIDAQCQSLGNGWNLNNCQDTQLSGSRNCPAGSTGEALFCEDGVVEQHSARRDEPAGVRSFFQDTSQDRCENIISVEVVYKVDWSEDRGSRTIAISRDGSSWTSVITNPVLNPSGDLVVDVTSSLAQPWECEDFFSSTSNAGIEAFWTITGGNPSQVLSMEVDTLVYRVTYEFETFPLDIDRSTYRQGENILISGVDIWDENSFIDIEILSPNNTSISSFQVLIDSQGGFTTNFELNDYAQIGNYSIFASQENDSSINATVNFSVVERVPDVFSTGFFYAPGETALFQGSNWIKNETIDIELFTPSGLRDTSFSDSIITSLIGDFQYEFQIPNNVSINTGNYELRFTERNNSNYNDNSDFRIVFRPNLASSGALSLINESDGVSFNVGGSGGTTNLDVVFAQTLVDDGSVELDSFELNMIYSTSGSTTRLIQWLNPSTSSYETVCTVPDSSSISTFTCNMTDQAREFNSFNNFNIRLTESGGPSVSWFVDFLYVTRDFSEIDDSDSLYLSLKREKKIIGDNTELSLILQNKDDVRTPLGKSVFVYVFTSDYYDLDTIEISEGDFYSSLVSSNSSSAFGVQGVLHLIELFPSTTFNSVFDRFVNEFNSTNSANISFIFSTNEEFFEDANLYYVGFDSLLVR